MLNLRKYQCFLQGNSGDLECIHDSSKRRNRCACWSQWSREDNPVTDHQRFAETCVRQNRILWVISSKKNHPIRLWNMGFLKFPKAGKIFTEMSVLENLELGAFVIQGSERKRPKPGTSIRDLSSIG